MIRTPVVDSYLRTLRPPADELLRDMEAFARQPRVPIADPETATLVAMLARVTGGPVLEVGLAIGYTALQAARALPAGGRVVSLESDPGMVAAARGFLSRDPAGARVEIVEGDARDTMPAQAGPFGVVFVDADKTGYPEYLELALSRLRGDGFILLDNLLMDGAAADGAGTGHWSQPSVDAGRAVSRRLRRDPALRFVLLPVGDGVGLVQRA
jgi:predicted O-methyltransferase YrrM